MDNDLPIETDAIIGEQLERQSIREESPESRTVVDYVESRTAENRIRLMSSGIAAGVVGLSLLAIHDSVDSHTKLIIEAIATVLVGLAAGKAVVYDRLHGRMDLLREKKNSDMRISHILEQTKAASPSMAPAIERTEERFCGRLLQALEENGDQASDE